ELVADQVADHGIGVGERGEQRRHAGGIGAGPPGAPTPSRHREDEEVQGADHGSCPSASAAARRTLGSGDCSAACSAWRAAGSSALASPSASVMAAAPLWAPKLPSAWTTALRTSADGS